ARGRRRALRRGPARDGADRRLGDADARLLRLRGEAAAAVLGDGRLLQGLRRERDGGAPAAGADRGVRLGRRLLARLLALLARRRRRGGGPALELRALLLPRE